MAYEVLYRQWRPHVFDEVVGQSHVVRTLQNALTLNKVAHAYLFTGPKGTGKTTVARLLAKSVNCASYPSPNPCNACDSCRSISAGASPNVLEIDAASNRGIDEIRDLRERVKYLPVGGRKNVYIIDEAHMLTQEACNALLKILEEPPSHVLFVLATTEPQKLLGTIVSRCQRFEFRRLSPKEISNRLKLILEVEKVKIEDEALDLISRHAEGSLRDALVVLEQALGLGVEVITAETVRELIGGVSDRLLESVTRAIAQRKPGEAVFLLHEALSSTRDPNQLIKEWISYLRDLLMAKLGPPATSLVARQLSADIMADAEKEFPDALLLQMIRRLARIESEARWSGQATHVLEAAVIELAHGADDVPQRVQALEERLERLASWVGYNRSSERTPDARQGVDNNLSTSSSPGEIAETRNSSATAAFGSDLAKGSGQPAEAPADVSARPSTPGEEWRNLIKKALKEACKRHANLIPALEGVKLLTIRKDKILIAAGSDARYTILSRSSNLKLLEDYIQKYLGRPCKLEVQKPGSKQGEVLLEDRREPVNDLTQILIEEFGGQVVEAKE